VKLLRRTDGGPPPAWRTLLVVALIAAVVATVSVLPGRKARSVEVASESAAPGSVDAGAAVAPVAGAQPGAPETGASGGGPSRVAAAAGVASPKAGLTCAAGHNGGATDVGVSATSIKLGATVVDSGVGAAFLRDARYGMLAVKDKVNRAGGICGRMLDLNLVDDGWDFQRGGDFLRSLVQDNKVFALAVVPSSEGLKNVSDAGFLRQQGVPVVGSDGMLIHQYTDPNIWPVAASTISSMHIIAKNAYDSPKFTARNFALVYESTYHFGIEGAFAFNQAVKRLTGHDIPGYSDPTKSPRCDQRFCAIRAGQPSYTSEIQTFNDACRSSPGCDYVVLLLEPATALTWINGGAFLPAGGRTAGVQPLFTREFAEQCRKPCNTMWLWTGFVPAIEANLGRPAVAAYADDIAHASSSADASNSFVEGAYVGMSALVEALRRVGPDVTRARLRAVLNSMTFDTGLTLNPLTWTPVSHFANTRMQAYSIRFVDRFSGWADEQVALTDPWVGLDMG
jgi:ABC-type branched-subunit amino acid transport system substrate-binding protein